MSVDPVTERKVEVSWTQRVTNGELLRRMKKSKELSTIIKERKTIYIGHIMRGDRFQLLRLIIEGKI